MNQLLEYATRHPFLLSAAVLLASFAIALELRHRARGSASVSPADAVRLMNKGGTLLLDVRDLKAYEAGHIIDARSVPLAEFPSRLETFKKYKDKPVIIYCDNGMSSSNPAVAMKSLGFSQVVTLRGGLQSWRQENLPVVKSNPVKRKDGKAA